MKRVVVVYEPTLDILDRFDTIQEAEAWIAEREKSDPAGVCRGDYGIDAPEEML